MRKESQRKGIGRALMAWGLERTDKQNLESYIEASAQGRELYEHCGYGQVARVEMDFSRGPKGAAWQDWDRRVSPYSFSIVWRPRQEDWINEPAQTWDDRIPKESRKYGEPQQRFRVGY